MKTRRLFWLAALALVFILSVPPGARGQTSTKKAATTSAQTSQWTTHRDPQSYSVRSPPDWSAWPSREKGWVHLMGPQGENVVIWPVFIPGTLDARSAQLIHSKLAASCPFNAEWSTPQPVGPAALRARGVTGGAIGVSVFTWVASPKGTAGYLYVTAAREAEYRQKQGDLVRILESVRIVGAPAGGGSAAAGAVRYVPYADPNEAAFSLDVPAGWKTSGGLFRANSLDYRVAVETISADGQIRILYGDPDIPQFIEPFSPYFPEGSWYAPYGFKQLVRRFTHGGVFSREYVLSKAPQICSNLEVTDVKDRADVVPEMVVGDPSLAQGQLTIGETRFRCNQEGQPRIGFCAAATFRPALVAAGTPSIWRLSRLTGYMAPAEKEAMAASILNHMGRTFQVNPQWAMGQIRNEGATSQIISQTANQIADMAAKSQRARDAVDDEISRRRSNAMLGVVDVVDSATGREIKVESGSSYYWIDQRGTIVGTDTDTRPNVDFRALVQLP